MQVKIALAGSFAYNDFSVRLCPGQIHEVSGNSRIGPIIPSIGPPGSASVCFASSHYFPTAGSSPLDDNVGAYYIVCFDDGAISSG